MAYRAPVVRGEVWWASTQAGDRPVLVLTRDPIADRIDAVVVALCTRRIRGLISELPLGAEDGMPDTSVVSFDNLQTLPKEAFRRRITHLSEEKMEEACEVLSIALGCV
jgi:mRNA interferase MazF